MRVKIYQINAEKDENAKRFSPFSYAEEHGGVNSDKCILAIWIQMI